MGTMLRRNRIWLLAIVAVTLLTVMLLFVPQANAEMGDERFASLPAAPNAQILSGDLEVEAGTVYEEDVVVYDGDVSVKDGGLIRGSLVVYSGDITIEEGGVVEGDVSAFSGDIDVRGQVGGDLASWSGDIKLDDFAAIGGDVSVLSGDVSRGEGVTVGGSVVQGPSLRLPSAVPPLVPGPAQMMPDGFGDMPHQGPGFFGSIGRFVGRLFGALLLAILFGAVAAAVTVVRPNTVNQIEETVRREPAASIILGVAGNAGLLLLTLVLVITLCLWPIPLLVLLVANLMGWTGSARVVGRYVSNLFHLDLRPPLVTGLGAVTMLGAAAPFWALGGCLRFFVWVGLALFTAVGTGAFLLPWFNRWRSGELNVPGMGGSRAPATAQTVDAAPATAAEVVPVPASGPATATAGPPSPASAATPPQPTAQNDDLTAIPDIGPVFNNRLRAAGIRTYAQLAAMTPEQVGDIIGWSAEQVVASGIIEEAKRLVQ